MAAPWTPPVSRCPRCGESDEVEELAGPYAKTKHKHYCDRCDLAFVGSPAEWDAERDARLARREELHLDDPKLDLQAGES